MMDKKGDIPITILVIGVFVVCTLALFSFFSAVKTLNYSFTGLDVIEDMNYEIEKDPSQNYYQEKADTKWSLRSKVPKVIFSVEYSSP